MKKLSKGQKVYTLKQAAQQLIDMLKDEGVRVMRYDAYSSNSIYLKLDDGVLGTIRISDHPGKRHLKYKYNLMLTGERYKRMDNGIMRHFYPITEIESLFGKIRNDYWVLMNQYGDWQYEIYMKRNREEGQSKKGFWQKERYI